MRRLVQLVVALTMMFIAATSTTLFPSALGQVVAKAEVTPLRFDSSKLRGEAPESTESENLSEEKNSEEVDETDAANLNEVIPPKTVEEIIRLASTHYSLDSNQMIRIAKCESRLGTQTVESGHLGVYQFTPHTWNEAATAAGFATEEGYYDRALKVWLVANPHNPWQNVWAAAWLAKRYGYGKWPVCRFR